MPLKSSRKLFLFGRYSLALLLPKKWLHELGIQSGDRVALEFDRKRKRVVIRFDQVAGSIPLEKKEPLKKTNDSDWQPIPHL